MSSTFWAILVLCRYVTSCSADAQGPIASELKIYIQLAKANQVDQIIHNNYKGVIKKKGDYVYL